MTSQMSMFILSHRKVSSLMRAMFTLRKMFSSSFVDAADDLRRVAYVPLPVAGVDALRGECEVEVFSADESLAFESREHHLFRRAGIGCAFQHYELAFPQVERDFLRRLDDVRDVRLLEPGKRGGKADEDRVALFQN